MKPVLRRDAYVVALALFTITLSDPSPRAQTGSLLPSVDLRRDVRLYSEVWPGDFNGDGITDLVASQQSPSGGIQVVPGRGDGTFGDPVTNPFVGRVIQVADFNGDRRVDVVVAGHPPAHGVAILPSNGNGTFAAPRQVESGFGGFAVTGDFNGDGRRDLVVGGWPEVRVFPGNGNFTFGNPARFPYDGPGPADDCLFLSFPSVPCGGGVAADFDNDDDLDFVVAAEFDGIRLFMNQGRMMFVPQLIPLGFQHTDITAGDLDADGNVDLVASLAFPENGDFPEGFVDVVKGNGDGTFATAIRYRTGNGPFQVVVGDFTRDGQLDIATANRSYVYWPNCGPFIHSSDSVTILPGNRGVFGVPTTFALHDQSEPVLNDGDQRFRNTVFSLNTSDLDRDRFPDLIASQGALLLTRPPAANRPPVANAGPDRLIENSNFVELIGTAVDPDNHLLDFLWRSSGIALGVVGQSTACFEGITDLGPNVYTLSVDDRHGGRDDDTAVHTLTHTLPGDPEVDVVRPSAGEVVDAGVPYTVRWTASDADGISRVDVVAYLDVGPNVRTVPIAECAALPGTAAECTWRHPSPTESALIAVIVRDARGNLNAATSDPFVIRGTPAPGALPEGWTSRDIGAVSAAGASRFTAGRVTVRGSGADIWNQADEFHYAYRILGRNAQITARVDTVENVNRWVKAGLMIRESPAAGARHASLFATPTTEKGVAFQHRPTTGGTSVHIPGPAIAPPVWLRLTRVDDVFRAYYRKNTVDAWTLIGEQTIPQFELNALVGFAVSSHVDGRVAEATFSEVSAETLPFWFVTQVGPTQGRGTLDQTRFSIEGEGADIWGTTDTFTWVVPNTLRPVEQISARVVNLENTHAWAKAGVMIRDDFRAGSPHVMVIVSPGKGIAMQWRPLRDGPSFSTTPRPGRTPAWVRVIRAGNTYTGQTSSDGVTWVTLGIVEVEMELARGGLVVTSHVVGTYATAVFDDATVREWER